MIKLAFFMLVVLVAVAVESYPAEDLIGNWLANTAKVLIDGIKVGFFNALLL